MIFNNLKNIRIDNDIKQKDIAELLDIKLSLVKYRIGRAKKLLSEYLEVREWKHTKKESMIIRNW